MGVHVDGPDPLALHRDRPARAGGACGLRRSPFAETAPHEDEARGGGDVFQELATPDAQDPFLSEAPA